MRLDEYFRREGKGAKSRLARDTGLAYSTIHAIERGRSVPKSATAQLIAAATGYAVTAEELLGLADHPEAAE